MLAGRAGVGKTALAVHIAHRVAPGFPDGQLYARLDDEHGEPVRPEAVLERLLRVLGVPAAAGSRDELAARLRSALAGRRILVVLDGAVDEAQVLSLLPGSATCGVLVTEAGTGSPGCPARKWSSWRSSPSSTPPNCSSTCWASPASPPNPPPRST